MNRKPGYGAKLRANLEPTKGVGRLRQQDGGHGSRNPLRSVLPTLESTQSEGRVQRLEEHRTSRGVRQGKSAKWIRNLGKGLALRAGHGGPSPEPVGCRRTARAASAARAGRRVPAGGRLGTALFGGLPGRRTANSELSESGLEATRVPAACLPTSSRGLGPQRHVSLAKPVRRTSRAGRLEVQFPSSGG
ncbi:hypothetical protein L6452_46179 [Arctium lappa]|nr:hypothetical protein L6452_46179 [Arctium lappa]